MAKQNLDKLDRKALRALAEKVGVNWSKTEDDDASLRKKISKALAAAEAPAPAEKGCTAFDVTRRAPTWKEVHPLTKKEVVTPTGCFGWAFLTGKNVICAQCPHAKPCAKLFASAPAAKALLEDADEAAAELEEMSADAVAETLAPKAKKAKKEAASESESFAAPAKSRKGMGLSAKDSVKVLYDEDFVASEDDEDLRKFYRRVLRAAGASKGVVPVSRLFTELGRVGYDVSDIPAALAGFIGDLTDGVRFSKDG